MPGFIKTPADEKKWQAIKRSVAKQRGKSVEDFTDSDWATVNAAWHKSEGNTEAYQEILKSAMAGLKPTTVAPVPGVISPGQSNSASPMKVGSQAVVKSPKAKKMGQATDKPSVFYKNEELKDIKKSSIENLRVFLENHRSKKRV